jgi:tripartite-type tricarboxylate transporter receptor subunit TctC
MRNVRVCGLLFALSVMTCSYSGAANAAANEETYPAKPIRFVVPFAPGGTNDILARMIANHLSEQYAKPVIVDNRPGADGVIGTQIVSKSAPDGYTMLIVSAAYAMNPAVRSLPFDPKNAVDFVMKVGDGPTILTVGPALKVNSVKELFAVTRAKPGQIVFGTSGGFQHFATALFRGLSGQDINIVVYKGAGPALIDVLGGQTHATIVPIVPSLPHIRSGKLTPLAAGTLKRSSMFPQMPTLDELGVKGYHSSNWYAIAVPPGTPKPVVTKLYDDISVYMRLPATVKTFTSMGGELDLRTADEVREMIPNEIAKWTKVAIDSGMARDVR